jgi:hypothetical protein
MRLKAADHPAEPEGAGNELGTEASQTLAGVPQVMVLEPETLEKLDCDILAPGGEEHLMPSLSPQLDGMAEEVHMGRMGQVDQDAQAI